MAKVDYLVVGAGFAGAVLAERLASQLGKRVLVVDRRDHVGGNAHDHFDAAGVLVHKYGPHLFHTNSERIFRYLSHFTAWRPYEYRAMTTVDGKLLPFPINLDTVNGLYGTEMSPEDLDRHFAKVRLNIPQPRNSEEAVCAHVGRELYEKFFRGYTRKQWGRDASELDPSVCMRVPAKTSRDDRYFTDTWQCIPLEGYTRIFERMLDHPLVEVRTGTSFRDVAGSETWDEMIWTGPIDEYFDHRFGPLPYRSLHFRFETHDVEWYQPAAAVHFPNDHEWTRVVEYKHITGQVHPRTSITREIPSSEGEPYYPLPSEDGRVAYARYKELADAVRGVRFVGRLATYKYLNMDQVVGQALATFDAIAGRRIVPGSTAAASSTIPIVAG